MSPTFLCFPLLSFILASSLIVLLFLLLNYFWAPISVFISLSFPFFPILLNDFIYSWASVTTYISVAARSTFPARTLLGVHHHYLQSPLIFPLPSPTPLQSSCFSELVPSFIHPFIHSGPQTQNSDILLLSHVKSVTK